MGTLCSAHQFAMSEAWLGSGPEKPVATTSNQTSQPVDYSVTVVETADDSHAILLVHSRGRLAGSALNNSSSALEWARTKFKQYLDTAHQVSR
jgi:hypothetical protein